MKVYITKYALTTGIEEKESDDSRQKENMIVIPGCNTGSFDEYYHGEGKEWHKTKESAIKRAEEMRIKKIQNLKKQIEKLEKMKFE